MTENNDFSYVPRRYVGDQEDNHGVCMSAHVSYSPSVPTFNYNYGITTTKFSTFYTHMILSSVKCNSRSKIAASRRSNRRNRWSLWHVVNVMFSLSVSPVASCRRSIIDRSQSERGRSYNCYLSLVKAVTTLRQGNYDQIKSVQNRSKPLRSGFTSWSQISRWQFTFQGILKSRKIGKGWRTLSPNSLLQLRLLLCWALLLNLLCWMH